MSIRGEYKKNTEKNQKKYGTKVKHGGVRYLVKKGKELVASDGTRYVRTRFGNLRKVGVTK